MAELVSSATGAGLPVEGLVTTKAGYTKINIWSDKAVIAGETSPSVDLSNYKTIGLLVEVSGATEITVESSTDNVTWKPVVYLRFTTAGAGGVDIMGGSIYYRVKSSDAVTATVDIVGKG